MFWLVIDIFCAHDGKLDVNRINSLGQAREGRQVSPSAISGNISYFCALAENGGLVFYPLVFVILRLF